MASAPACARGSRCVIAVEAVMKWGDLVWVVEPGADDRGAHHGAVASGADTAARGWEAEPEANERAQRAEADGGWKAEQPPAQLPCERAREARWIVGGGEQGLRGHAGVLGVVAEHAQALVEWARIEARCAAPTEAFARKPEGVADGGPE
jgi:hypothetical protein